MANRTDIQQHITNWLDAHLAGVNDAQEIAAYQRLAAIQTQYVANLVKHQDNGDDAAAFLAASINDGEWRNGKYAMPVYSALAEWSRVAANKMGDDATLNTFRYEIARFQDLPDTAIANSIRNHGLNLIKYVKVLSELKRRYLLNQYWDDGSWVGLFLQALRDNRELVGREPIILNNNSYQPTVSAWLQKFDTSHVGSLENVPDAYDQVKFFNKDSQISHLDVEEKKALASLLKLYSWLQNPEVDEIELEAEERANRNPEDGWLDLDELNKVYGRLASFVPPPVPAQPLPVQPLPTQKKIDSIDAPRAIAPKKPIPTPVPAWVPSVPKDRPINRNMNVQNILNRGVSETDDYSGVRYDSESNVKVEEMAQRLEADRQQKKVSIDQKLEALKKRKINKS